MTYQSRRGKKKNRGRRWLGLFLALTLLVTNCMVLLGSNARAASEDTGPETVGQENTITETLTAEEPEETALPEWSEAEQQAAEQRSVVEQRLRSEASAQVTVTLDLNGGKVNGLEQEGWSPVAGEYVRIVEKDGQVILRNPYRMGYTFVGWQREGSEEILSPEGADESVTFSASQDGRLTALWEERLYRAEFHDDRGQGALWTVQVPYGSVLWTMEQEPWEAQDLTWTPVDGKTKPEGVVAMEQTEVVIYLGVEGADAEAYAMQVPHTVQVTRYVQEQGQKYHTFVLEDVPYFTYGGPNPEYAEHNFVEWQATGLGGYAVDEDGKIFQARYTAKRSYLFHVYYYFENGTKASDPTTVVVSEGNMTEDRSIDLEVPVPAIRFYKPEVGELPEGVLPAEGSDSEAGWTGKAVVDVAQAFQDDSQANPSVSIVVFYQPTDVNYRIVYHAQKVGEGTDKSSDYVELGSLSGRTKIGETVSVQDGPATLMNEAGETVSVDFLGYEADLETKAMIRRGKRLEPSMVAEDSDIAVIHVYYNRIYYYVYTLTDSNESDPFEPVRVQYGAELPADQDGSTLVKTGYQFQEWEWYQAGEHGTLQLLDEGAKPDVMPGYDVYAVAVWKAEKTKMQVVYWFEDANSGGFQNTYQKEVTGVPTGDKLVLSLEKDNYNLKTENAPIQSFPAFTETFEEAVCSKYGDDKASYKQYFTFDPTTTFQQEQGNHHAEGNQAGTELHYVVKADGTTTINLYYRRNLYTLQFVIQRTQNNGRGQRQVAIGTSGSLLKGSWHNIGRLDSQFHDFSSESLVKVENPKSQFGDAAVLGEWRIRDAVDRGDERAATGRYAKINIGSYECFVYYLTARFEADIAKLWPTVENISVVENQYADPVKYVSMGTNENSAYWNQGISNKNILNQYSTMDPLIVNNRYGVANPDNKGMANVTHQLYAYWALRSRINEYQYYFLYEALDTTLQPAKYREFNVGDVDGYEDGTIVKWRSRTSEPYRLYVYRKNNVKQNSTNTIQNQNQPARYGFRSMGKTYKSIGNGGNVYFFYARNELTLSIYNVNGNWVPGSDFLKKKLPLTYVDELTEQTVSDEKSLAELGWVDVVNDPKTGERLIHLRYGARLGVIRQASVTDAFQEEEANPLKYPYKSMGVNQYYFHGWYKDQENIVSVDWNTNAMQNMIQDQVLYVGWTTPKYRITYALNGGSWTDRIDMTFFISYVEGEPVVFYYPHETTDPMAEVYWYVPEKKTDYLYMASFHIGRAGDLLDMESPFKGHYKLKWDTLEEMIAHSSHVKDPGISSGGDSYLCNLGEQGVDDGRDTSHRRYVDRHAQAGSILPEPSIPVRNGYDFLGWFAFEEEASFHRKVWLDEVLSAGEGLHSYQSEYVYLDASGNPHLLYEDPEENGRLYYYDDQEGYQYRFQFGASIASQDRTLYAAWKGQQVNESKTMYLVPKSEIAATDVDPSWSTVLINGTEYYRVFEDEIGQEIESGSTLTSQAKPLTKIRDGRIWLPEKATISLELGSGTPEGLEEREGVYSYAGTEPVFKVRIPNLDTEAYTYYSYFVYHPVDQPTYTVYCINLTEAVLKGDLRDYEDRFDRGRPPDVGADYLIGEPMLCTYEKGPNDAGDGIVTVRASAQQGYTVYEKWVETLQLESDPRGNNIYFYYINPDNNVTFNVTYHFMTNGNYTSSNMIRITGYPGVKGLRLGMQTFTEGYVRMLETAERMRSYAGSENQAETSLYQRYEDMKVERYVDGVLVGTHAVNVSAAIDLDMEAAKAIAPDYVLDYYTPAAVGPDATVIVSEGMDVHVFLKNARLQLNKKDSAGMLLKDATFEIQRYRRVRVDETVDANAHVVLYENAQYVRDDGFTARRATTDESGKVIFYDLSANQDPEYIYQVRELQAPPGHTPLAEPVYAKVPYQVTDETGTTTYYSVTYDIVNPGIPYLPETGGGGVLPLLFAGGGIVSSGLLMGDTLYRRKRDRRRKVR